MEGGVEGTVWWSNGSDTTIGEGAEGMGAGGGERLRFRLRNSTGLEMVIEWSRAACTKTFSCKAVRVSLFLSTFSLSSFSLFFSEMVFDSCFLRTRMPAQ